MIEFCDDENDIKLKFNIVRYQFPELEVGLDANWCLLKIEVTQDNNRFQKIDPALETHDLTLIYDWFKCLSEDRLPRYAHLQFIEPCISFKFLARSNDTIRIAIILDFELKPNFDLVQFQTKFSDWSIIFELTDVDFQEILSGLEQIIKKYPIRCES